MLQILDRDTNSYCEDGGENSPDEKEFSSFFKVEIDCENESEQESIYNKLISEGYQCRILTL